MNTGDDRPTMTRKQARAALEDAAVTIDADGTARTLTIEDPYGGAVEIPVSRKLRRALRAHLRRNARRAARAKRGQA
ncbi:MAG: hypothetical protein RID81_06975 [Sandaracinaceae bacterium]